MNFWQLVHEEFAPIRLFTQMTSMYLRLTISNVTKMTEFEVKLPKYLYI